MVSCWLLVVGYWLLIVGCWSLVVGYILLVIIIKWPCTWDPRFLKALFIGPHISPYIRTTDSSLSGVVTISG